MVEANHSTALSDNDPVPLQHKSPRYRAAKQTILTEVTQPFFQHTTKAREAPKQVK